MSLRARIAAVAGLAVAAAVLTAAVSLYFATRSELRGEIDRSLQRRATDLLRMPPSGGPRPPVGAPPPGGVPGGFPGRVQPVPLGGSSGYVQFCSPDGQIHIPAGQGPRATIALDPTDRSIAQRGSGRTFSDRTVSGTSLRVLTVGAGSRGAIIVARPLTEANRELTRLLVILAIVGAGGIALAAALGALVARAALAPIARFVRRTESLAGELDLSRRLDSEGRDELARLARSFNATLDALERSVQTQRNLIADASHELRTPIASLRANIQLLEHAERLSDDDQQGLRQDIISELDELTGLIADIVELARGTAARGEYQPLQLEQVVAEAVARVQRHRVVRFQTRLEPTVISGDEQRVSRAVSNLLENACKWSPRGGLIEVDLSDGMLTVRDHGPGFEPQDLPHVFERFYRAAGARKLPGSGLGLAIVQQTAISHGGRVSASNAPGGGAQVTISFGQGTPDQTRTRS
jgi:two-component system sensor histidine kinase MprB